MSSSFFDAQPTPFNPIEQPTTSSFTCISCLVQFENGEDQRSHYRTDWHRYNLKRKVAEMPPVSQEEFAKRLQMQQEKTKSEALKSAWEAKCDACSKTYYNENSFTNHLQSKKHKEAVQNMEKMPSTPDKTDEMDVEPTDASHVNWKIKFAQATSEQEVQDLIKQKIALAKKLNVDNDCLFCSHTSSDFDANMEHMTRDHSLYIPDVEYLTDLHGLIEYLAEKVAVANICLYCNGKGRQFHSMEAVRKHMIDRGHCKIAYDDDDDLEELAAFYDFPEEETPKAEWDPQTQELVLPSGARAGHRQFRQYYKQYLKPTQIVNKPTPLVNKLKSQYKQLGWTDTTPPTQAQVAQIVRDQRRARMREARTQILNGISNNKTLQKHARPQVMF